MTVERGRLLRSIAAAVFTAAVAIIALSGPAFGRGLAFGQAQATGSAKAPQGTVAAAVPSGGAAVAAFARVMTFNAAAGSVIKLVLRDNVASSSVANPTLGQTLTLLLCQDNFGSRTLAWPGNLRLAGGNFVLTRIPNRCDALTMVYDGSTWYETSRALNE
jgi:hypothetical protein